MPNRNPLFEKTVDFLIDEIEGGEVNAAADKGGHTKYGISKHTFPKIDIATLTRQQAIDIYYEKYWLPFQCDKFVPGIAVFVFGCAVHHRPRTGPRLLQQALRANLLVDGIIGEKTIAAANKSNCSRVLTEALALRADLFHDLVVADSSQAIFLIGWFSRLFKLHRYILSLHNES